ncbi:glycosyltransferase family 1 protein [Sphaerisporangium album]|uniref:Glycosyltransferase family 1 protein n=1 Tax=Sphaerisporangium album TaxID=509200 RepID=A0A367FNU4_9ACTN|nr:glycosyltransferase [Sphaerisporangium album]RCG32076.1 glycosyltransferase family 1 protein [Sphaerisporangium album]
MKVAMVSEHASPLAMPGSVDSGGQNVHVAALARALAAMGHEVTVHTRRDDPDLPETVEYAPGVSVVHVPAGPPARIAKDEILAHVPDFAHWLRQRWLFRPPDVVHSHFWMSGLAALAAARDPGVPVVHTFHALGVVKRRHQGPEDTSPEQRLKAETVVARGVAKIVATCGDEVDELTRMDVPRRAVTVVPCGVDSAGFGPSGPAAPRPHGLRLLSIGRLVPRKGVLTIIEAMRLIPDAELIVAGGPPAEELDGDPEVARLRRAASEAGVAARVRFIGQVAHEDVPALMRAADVAVCVPWYEPFGMVALEAMACGLPVVASAVGGQRETVVDGRTGTLVPPRDPRALAAAVNSLLADPSLRAAYGKAGARRARTRYAWPRIAAATAAVYEDVVADAAEAHDPLRPGRKAS